MFRKSMNFRPILQLILTVLIVAEVRGNTGTCVDGRCYSLPLLDAAKGVLKADIDMTEINKGLQQFVVTTIHSEVTNAIAQNIKDIVKTEVQSAVQDIVPVTKVAFSATLSNGNTKTDISENDVVVFDKILLNEGGAYSNTSGKFTCPRDGPYFFSWTTLSDAYKDFSSELTVNGSPYIVNVVDNDVTDDHLSSTTSLTVELKKGDNVWIKGHTTEGKFLEAAWDDVPVTVFTGFGV